MSRNLSSAAVVIGALRVNYDFSRFEKKNLSLRYVFPYEWALLNLLKEIGKIQAMLIVIR